MTKRAKPNFSPKRTVKRILGELPMTAELYWQIRQQGKPLNKSFSLHRTKKCLPGWIADSQERCGSKEPYQAHKSALLDNAAIEARGVPKRVMFFVTLRYWIEHATLLSLAMAGLGHNVTMAYLPYNNWRSRMNRFDLRRQNLYARKILQPASIEKIIRPVSFLDVPGENISLPDALRRAIEQVSIRDAQYTLQVEEIDIKSELYRLRLERNTQAASAAWVWLTSHRPDVLVTPNGSILEMGAVYQTARYLDIPVVTYEFGEQRDRIWLATNDEVMLQHTSELWARWKDYPLSEAQLEKIRSLYASRQQASLWENFSRRWQGQPSQGGELVRQAVSLDQRPD